jgi:hypothetical protein
MANLFERYEGESYPGQCHVVCQDDVEIPNRYGWGRTLEEARDAWGEVVLERVDDHIHDLMTSAAISKEDAEAAWTAIDVASVSSPWDGVFAVWK